MAWLSSREPRRQMESTPQRVSLSLLTQLMEAVRTHLSKHVFIRLDGKGNRGGAEKCGRGTVSGVASAGHGDRASRGWGR